MQYTKISGFSDEISKEIDVQFSVLNKLGISYFEPRGVDGNNISALDDDQVLALKEKMAAAGIRASSIGSPIGKIKITEDFAPHFALFQRVVRTAKLLDCRYIRIFSFYHEGEEWTACEREEVFRRLREMIAYAKEEDVVLLHENEKEIYGDTAKRCLDIMENLADEHFGAVFDPANFVQCGEDTKAAFDMLVPYIRYMHIKDARYSDRAVVPAGMGDGNFTYILSALRKNGYSGFLSLEPHLGTFKGLEDLETDDLMKGLPEGGEGTFTLAYNTLCGILDGIVE